MRTQPYERDWGLHGCDAVADTSAQTNGTAGYYAMLVIADAVVSAMTFANTANHDGDWSDFTSIPAGTLLMGNFTSLTLTSGEVLLYRNVAS